MKRIYIVAFHQSKFGKLMGMLSIPEILRRTVQESCAESNLEPSAIDSASGGAVCKPRQMRPLPLRLGTGTLQDIS